MILQRRHILLLWLVAALSVMVALYGAWKLIPPANAVNHVAGSWIGQSYEISQGVVYRPLMSEDGFGGSRYFPLPLFVMGFLMKLGVDPLYSGFIFSAGSLIGALAGVYTLLRTFSLSPLLAFPLCLCLLAAEPIEKTWLSGRGDLLAMALNLWGLVFSLQNYFLLAGIIFGFAWSSKLTMVFGLLSVCIFLFFKKEWQGLLKLCLAFFITAVLLIGITQWASEGRMLQIFFQSAGGGLTFKDLGHVIGGLYRQWFLGNIFTLTLFVFAWAVWLITAQKLTQNLIKISFLVTTVLTMIILCGPGTDLNQLIDLVAMSLLTAAILMPIAYQPLLVSFFLVWTVMANINSLYWFKFMKQGNLRETMELVWNSTLEGTGPLFAETPLIEIIHKQRPYLLDPFLLRIYVGNQPAIKGRVLSELSNQKFRAVVLQENPEQPSDPTWYESTHLGQEVINQILQSYRFKEKIGLYYIYIPKNSV